VDQRLRDNPRVRSEMPILEKRVVAAEMTPYAAARRLVDML